MKFSLCVAILLVIVSTIACTNKEEAEKLFNEYKARKSISKVLNPPKCPEIQTPSAGRYPWYEVQLPRNITPSRYDLEIAVPNFAIDLFFGEVDIGLTVNSDTKWLLLHEKYDQAIFTALVDKDGVDVNVECADRFNFNDYIVIKANFQKAKSPYTASFLTRREYLLYDSGMYEMDFGKPGEKSRMLVTRFEPIQAREVFPCFDEPGFRAPVHFDLEHPNDTIVVFNTQPTRNEPIPGFSQGVATFFEPTPSLPISLIGWAVFQEKDFAYKEMEVNPNTKIRLWARKILVDEGYAAAPLKEAVDIYTSLLAKFQAVQTNGFPKIVNIFALPEYPVDAIPHLGLLFVKENRLLYKSDGASQTTVKDVALLLAKNLAEFWFGNFISPNWWNELWLQEGISDYLKFTIVNDAYPEWLVKSHYIPEELINTLAEDGYPSSHPIAKPVYNPLEIKEYFDVVEINKAAGIFHMLDDEFTETKIIQALVAYLNAHKWGVADIRVFYESLGLIDNYWRVEDLFKRFTEQPNYPLLNIELVREPDNSQSVRIVQSRFILLNDSLFDTEDLYPSAYEWTWIVPVLCTFGTGTGTSDSFSLKEFYISEKDSKFVLDSARNYQWVHCNRKFNGFYATQYSAQNWEYLGEALNNNFRGFEPEDRAAIIHNAFLTSFTGSMNYKVLTEILSYLSSERDYVPWGTLTYHVSRLLNVLQYKKSFRQVSTYFIDEFISIEEELGNSLWTGEGSVVELFIKEILINFGCEIQEMKALDKTNQLWNVALPFLFTGIYNQELFPPHTRRVVYNYHIQNTYKVDDWDLILRDYRITDDVLEQSRYLESLTFSRLPWLLNQLIRSQADGELNNLDVFDTLAYLAKHPLGRETAWDFLRANYDDLLNKYGTEDPRIGKAILDISRSFETEFMFIELLEFFTKAQGGADGDARFKALEYAQANFQWVESREDEIIEAFSGRRKADGLEKKINKWRKNKSASKVKSFEYKPRDQEKNINIEEARKKADKYVAQLKEKRLAARNDFNKAA